MKLLADSIKKIKTVFEEKSVFLVTMTAFFVFLFMQHRLIGMYYDDFGNASLSYSYDSSAIPGTQYTVGDLLEWSRFIYFNWGGRIVYALILIPLLKNGPHLFMTIQSVVIMLIYFSMFKLIKLLKPGANSALMAVLFVTGYGMMMGDTLRHGVYWASASVLYVWPLLPFFISIYLYEKIVKKCANNEEVSFKDWGALIVLVPLSILSQEQLAGAFLVWAIIRTIINRQLETRWKGNIFLVVYSAVFFSLMIFAPGNFARMGTNEDYTRLPFIYRTIDSFNNVLLLLTHGYMVWFNELLVATAVIMLFLVKSRINKIWWVAEGVLLIPFAVINTALLAENKVCTDALRADAFLVFGISLCILIVELWWKSELQGMIPVMVCAVASVFCLILSPAFNLRSCIPYIMMCMLMVIVVFDQVFTGNYKVMIKSALIALTVWFCYNAVSMMAEVYSYYSSNYYADEYNRNRLFDYDGNEKEIYILKYNNALGRGTMSCDGGFESIDYWVKEFYNIPVDVEIVWKDQDELFDSMMNAEYETAFGDGFYEDEGDYRWTAQSAEFMIRNKTDNEKKFIVSFDITAPAGASKLTAYLNDTIVYESDLSGERKNVSFDLSVGGGDNILRITSDAERVDSGADSRELYMTMESFALESE